MIRLYHERSTHHPGRFAPGPGYLDWANQPDPFRVYEGAPVLELPLADDAAAATWDRLHAPGAIRPRPLDIASLGAFFELSLGLTAWKEYRGHRWALRANPSSGNLHPTEGYALVPATPGVPAGLYHYVSRHHVLERRFTPRAEATLARLLPRGPFVFGLTSIHWREAWKYGERAFRYCQHDAGHALATARYAAAVLGWTARLLDAAGDPDVAALLGLDRESDFASLAPGDREHPDALVLVGPPREIEEGVARVEGALETLTSVVKDGEWAGRPNALSPEHATWPEIEAVAEVTLKPSRSVAESTEATRSTGGARSFVEMSTVPLDRGVPAVALIRKRRSAVAMDGRTSIPARVFFEMVDRLLPRREVPPWDVLPWAPRVHPVLFVHRVDGLAPGLYVLERDAAVHAPLRGAMRPGFRWGRPDGCPETLRLYLLEEGDAREFAQLVSCHQEIAADSAFSLGMLSRFDESLREGSWWYRRLFWETGVLGQALYLEAEAAGVRATGIGCYFDDVVHEVLGLVDDRFRDLYHFTVGGAVDDPRLTTLPAYPEEVRGRPATMTT